MIFWPKNCVNTELAKIAGSEWFQGWVLYDAGCPSCRRFARLAENIFTRRGFDLAPLQSPWVRECFEDFGQDPLSAVRVITVKGQSFSGADALIFLGRRIWWAWPLALIALLPGVKSLLRRAYGHYASRRCLDECQGIRRATIKQKPDNASVSAFPSR